MTVFVVAAAKAQSRTCALSSSFLYQIFVFAFFEILETASARIEDFFKQARS